MTTRTIEQPGVRWYREPWPWILIGLPASAVIAGIVTLVIAVKNEDGLVAEDYYKQGLAINQVIEREAQAVQMGLKAQMLVAGRNVRIHLDGSRELPGRIVVRFIHPTRAGEDREIELTPVAPGWYEANLPDLAQGRWRLQIEDAESIWRLTGVWNTNQKSLLIPGANAS